MVDKTEGAEMTCRTCGTDLICRMKEYKGDFAPKLQWQNENGTAHYSTKDGKNFSCNIPEGQDQESIQTGLWEKTITTASDSISPNISLDVKVDKLIAKADSILDTCVSILHIVSDIKTQGVKISTGTEQVKEIREKHND